MKLLLFHLNKTKVYILFKIILNKIKVEYMEPLQKIIKLNFVIINNVNNILTKNLNKCKVIIELLSIISYLIYIFFLFLSLN